MLIKKNSYDRTAEWNPIISIRGFRSTIWVKFVQLDVAFGALKCEVSWLFQSIPCSILTRQDFIKGKNRWIDQIVLASYSSEIRERKHTCRCLRQILSAPVDECSIAQSILGEPMLLVSKGWKLQTTILDHFEEPEEQRVCSGIQSHKIIVEKQKDKFQKTFNYLELYFQWLSNKPSITGQKHQKKPHPACQPLKDTNGGRSNSNDRTTEPGAHGTRS